MRWTLEKQLNQVAEFHRKIGETVAESPELLDHCADLDRDLARALRQTIDSFNRNDKPKTQLTRRALMAIEELAEWIEAHNEDDLIAAADALGDRLYVLLGDAVATSMPVEQILDEVHRSNMTKHRCDDSSGKGIKSEEFESPRMQDILRDVRVPQRSTSL